jgi:hypothetical protein
MGLAGNGKGVATVSANDGDICAIFTTAVEIEVDDLPVFLMREETTILVWAQLHGDDNDGHDFTVELDNQGADASITSSLDDGEEVGDYLEGLSTNEINDLGSSDTENFDDELFDLLDEFAYFDINGVDDTMFSTIYDSQFCDATDDPVTEDDDIVLVDVTCEEDGAGVFDVSFVDQSEDDDSLSIEIECRGDSDDDVTTIDANPASIEIVPARGNVAHSFIRVLLEDADGNPAFPGPDVLFTVDRCTIEEQLVDEEGDDDADPDDPDAEFEGAEALFRTNYSVNDPLVRNRVETSVFALDTNIDSTRSEDNSATFTVVSDSDSERTVAGAIVHCEPKHTGSSPATPGVITVTAIVEQDGSADDIFTVKITLVGPPASITINASPTELRCGEKAQVVVVIKDAIGQNVSDHTQFEAVTNAGGVLGGTGAVIGLAGPVVPISSTVGETFAGTSTFFLITSEQHSGPYEVVVTTGGAAVTSDERLLGLFSSPPISVQTTVRCTLPVVAAAAPAPVATIKAPSTGDLGTTSIRPPSTGDAGLADASGASWMLIAIGGVVAFTLVGVATAKVTRR